MFINGTDYPTPDGTCIRDYVHVDDLARGLVAMLDSDAEGPINLGNPVELTVLQIAALVLELVGSASRIVSCPLPQDDPTRRRPDISRAQGLLGWSPRVPVRTGLARTIEWQANELRQNLAS